MKELWFLLTPRKKQISLQLFFVKKKYQLQVFMGEYIILHFLKLYYFSILVYVSVLFGIGSLLISEFQR